MKDRIGETKFLEVLGWWLVVPCIHQLPPRRRKKNVSGVSD
jgi:hypothetical protein